jgi:quercetin 2,3-dioxygenase
MIRKVNQIENATIEWVGANKVLQALPARGLKQVDPFLLIHHMVPAEVQPGASIRIPPHPHAGFEVVTYLMDGEFFHRDSKGNDSVARGGDVNWMTSGAGIVHSEGPTEHFLKTGGKLQLMQVWVNLPAKDKFVEASFRHYPADTLPWITTEHSRIKILMGDFQGKKSAILTRTPMFFYHVELKASYELVCPVNEQHSAALYVMDGKIEYSGQQVTNGQLMNFEPDGLELAFTALTDTSLIVFGGQPLREKLVSYGPFVMNSFEQIQQAMRDYETGKMGFLEY